MRKIILWYSIMTMCFVSNAIADPKDDAEVIASASITPEILEETFLSLRPSVVASLSRAYSERNISPPATDEFYDLLLEELTNVIGELTQDVVVDYYSNNFSENELSEIATFFRSDAGQAYVSRTPDMMRQMTEVTNTFALEAIRIAANRMESRIQEEGLVVVEDPDHLSRLLDVLK